jgi:hypothetical protein
MKLPRRRFLHLAAGAAALPAVSRIASAQAYPSRPITLVVPFPPGGPTDLLGRMVGERLRLSFGQSVVIENVQMYDQKEQAAFIQVATAVVLDERARRRQ